MVEVGGDGQQAVHDNLFGEAGTRQAVRVANAGQLAFLAAYLRPRGDGTASEELERRLAQSWGHAEWRRFKDSDMPHISKHLFGWVDEHGRHPGVGLKGAYEAWMRAAGTVDVDPRGARAAMEMCRIRIAQCSGGPQLLRLYDEYRHTGKRPRSQAQLWAQAVEAMRRAWRDSEPARQMGERGRPHEAAPDRPGLSGGLAKENLPVRVGDRPQPDHSTAAGEAAHLLGFPEVTLPQLQQFQRHHHKVASALGEPYAAAGRDGEVLARQWLEHMRRTGMIDQPQHDVWRDVVVAARRSPEHAQWRIERGLDPAVTPDAAASPTAAHDEAAARRADGALRGEHATAAHLRGHAGNHHRITDRKLGRAVDDPDTAHVDEQAQFRQEAYRERGVAELYDGQAAQVPPDRGMATRAAAARPSPTAAARAAPPPSLAGKRYAQLVQPRQPQRPTPERGRGR